MGRMTRASKCQDRGPTSPNIQLSQTESSTLYPFSVAHSRHLFAQNQHFFFHPHPQNVLIGSARDAYAVFPYNNWLESGLFIPRWNGTSP